jgi:hypothetical protein
MLLRRVNGTFGLRDQPANTFVTGVVRTTGFFDRIPKSRFGDGIAN